MPRENITADLNTIAFKLELPGVELAVVGACGWSKMLNKIIGRALEEKGILNQDVHKLHPSRVMALGNECLGFFDVTNQMDGLLTIRTELESLLLLRHAKIAWKDYREGIWRWWFPQDLTESPETINVLIVKWIAAFTPILNQGRTE